MLARLVTYVFPDNTEETTTMYRGCGKAVELSQFRAFIPADQRTSMPKTLDTIRVQNRRFELKIIIIIS
jgi:hypothetical protein